MEVLNIIIDTLFSFKAYVMLPVIILVIALAVRMKPGPAFLAALRLGVGFAGVFLVFDFFVGTIQPAVEAIVLHWNLDFTVLDVGWPPLAAITWSSPIAPLSIPLIIGINVLLIALNQTKTVYIDIFNYWHIALIGALVSGLTGQIALGLGASALLAVYVIKMSDYTAPHVEENTSHKGVTISPLSVTGLLPFAVLMDTLYDRIPGLKKWEINPEKQGGKMGILADPMMTGLIMGFLLGLAAGYSLKLLLETGVHIAAVMFLLPKCGELIGEGIHPVSSALKDRIKKRFPKKTELYVAMDTGILMNNKSVMINGLLLMPAALIIALILPGNRVLPLGDLPNLISVMSVIVLVSRGNILRSIITGLPIIATYLLISSAMAPLYTELSAEAGMTFAPGVEITAFTDGGNQVRFFLYHLFQLKLWTLASLPFIGAMIYLARKRAQKQTISNQNGPES
ncbi:MAG: PTS galactitol transporter subunit IIC [Spirochaetales bacterium]|nr:PTS galactitol transporter subunit IIC [Spirochaetales bacterium]